MGSPREARAASNFSRVCLCALPSALRRSWRRALLLCRQRVDVYGFSASGTFGGESGGAHPTTKYHYYDACGAEEDDAAVLNKTASLHSSAAHDELSR